jgi:hypothetical protein
MARERLHAFQVHAIYRIPTSSPGCLVLCCREGTSPNNGFVNGKLIYTIENALNSSVVSNPYRKDSRSPTWRFGTIYRMNPDGTGIELFATGEEFGHGAECLHVGEGGY